MICKAVENTANRCSLVSIVWLQDVGTAFGQDTRHLLLEGWSHEELVVTDVIAKYW